MNPNIDYSGYWIGTRSFVGEPPFATVRCYVCARKIGRVAIQLKPKSDKAFCGHYCFAEYFKSIN